MSERLLAGMIDLNSNRALIGSLIVFLQKIGKYLSLIALVIDNDACAVA
jgi:hypothetical protein